MDLSLFLRVLWRFREFVAVGFVVAVLLATLSAAKVSFGGGAPHLAFRQHEQWQSYTTLIISPRGFPWGRSVFSLDYDPSRYGTLATIYSNLAQSDAVKQRLASDSEVAKATILAQPILASANNSSAPPLPLMTIAATTASARSATAAAEHATSAFLAFLRSEQATNGIPAPKRVLVSEIKHATKPTLLKGHSKTTPIAVFLAVMIAVLAIAAILENMRPQIRAVDPTSKDRVSPSAAARRSA